MNQNTQCPNCGSYKTKKMGRISRFFLTFAAAGASALVGIIFFPVLIFTVLLLIAAPFQLFAATEYECEACGYKWKNEKKKKKIKIEKAEKVSWNKPLFQIKKIDKESEKEPKKNKA